MLGQEVLGHRTGRSLTGPGWRGLCLSRENTLGSVAGPRGSMTGMGWEDMNLGKCPRGQTMGREAVPSTGTRVTHPFWLMWS